MALAKSPEKRIPPSAISGTPVSLSAAATLATAVTCGTPTPATTRVVQIEPGPCPTFTPSTPASTRASAPSAGGHVAADDLNVGIGFANPADALQHALAVAVSGVDHDHVHVGGNQRGDALLGVTADAYRGSDQQPLL